MKKLIILGSILTSSLVQAEMIQSKVHAIEKGIVKFENGRVAFIDNGTINFAANDFIEAEINDRSSLVAFKKISAPLKVYNASLELLEETTPAEAFEPTVVQGMSEASNIFNRSNSKYKRVSECTDRAHVWAHEEFKKNGVKSNKVFVFFTASYIDSVRFKWWFHVAPLYKVSDRGSIKELVMDYRYTDRPMTVKEWTDQFVYTKRECKVTEKFSEYDVNPQTENCYLMYESMHYKLPADLSAKEKGTLKTQTSDSEVRASFSYAFHQ